jgi:hypothetical protein
LAIFHVMLRKLFFAGTQQTNLSGVNFGRRSPGSWSGPLVPDRIRLLI